mgnify:CR=1 FL=1
MKNLTQRLIHSAAALGLAACVSGTDINKDRKTNPELPPYAYTINAPGDIGYDKVKWNTVYFTAISTGINSKDENIYLANMRFESYLPGEQGIRVIRVLSEDEMRELNVINTRKKLADFLKGKADHYQGYIGPNLLL